MMADTTKMRALQNISNALPVANAKVAAGQQAGRDMQLQAAVQKAPAAANITQASQATGAATAANAGQQMVEGAQNQIKQQGQLASVGLQQQGTQAQVETAGQAAGAKEQAMDNVSRLAAIDSNAKKELYDEQMKFAQDENGRTLFNETQLADYAKAKAGSDEELRNYAQAAEQVSKRNLQMMETAYAKLRQDLDFKYQQAKQSGDQATMKAIQQQQYDNQALMEREANRAANRAAAWNAGGTLVGGAVGGFASGGSPEGIKQGAGAGGAVGGLGNALGGGGGIF